MVCVAITGVSGVIGQRVLPLLDADAAVDRIVGLDVRDPARRARRFDFHRVDVASGELKPLLEGADVVVHLAALPDAINDETLMARVNVDGTRRVLEAATSAGVAHVVRVSSATVYGAWANNPVPLTEDAPLRPNPAFAPAVVAAEVERLLFDWRDQHPDGTVTVLRAAPVMGAVSGTDHLSARLVAGRPALRIRGANPPVQVVHADDVASAVALAVTRPLPGAYNVACDGWLAPDAALALMPRRLVPPLPAGLVERVLRRARDLGLPGVSPGILPYLTNPWVVASDRLRAVGWSPVHTNEDTILETGDAARSRLPLVLAGGTAAAATAAAGVLVARRLRKRSSRHRDHA